MSGRQRDPLAALILAHRCSTRPIRNTSSWETTCATCGDLPGGPPEADHMAAKITAAGYAVVNMPRQEAIDHVLGLSDSIAQEFHVEGDPSYAEHEATTRAALLALGVTASELEHED